MVGADGEGLREPNKNDAADARAIWTAVQQPGIKAVAIKSEGPQAVLALHRMRAQLVKFRAAQVNGLRGLLAEYGEVMAQGRAGIRRDVPAALGRVAERLPAVVIDTLREQYATDVRFLSAPGNNWNSVPDSGRCTARADLFC